MSRVRYGSRLDDRYDLWKSFELDGGAQIGVAIEMERWEVWTDLLKFQLLLDAAGRRAADVSGGVSGGAYPGAFGGATSTPGMPAKAHRHT